MQTHQFAEPGATFAPCIWMQAGVVKRRRCTAAYECAACQFDRALHRESRRNQSLRRQGARPAGRRGQIVSWKDRLMALPPARRPCLHHLKGHISFRSCNLDYSCSTCEFDQYFSEQFKVFTVLRPVAMLRIKGVRFPQGYYLHRGHCWVSLEEGGTARVGLDDFALRIFGPLDRIEGPLLGKRLHRDTAAIAICRGPHAAQLLAPVSGVVTGVNAHLRESAGAAGADPYMDACVLKVRTDNLRQDLPGLMMGEQASRFIADEIAHLFQVIEDKIGPLAADGGYLGSDIIGHEPRLGWEALARAFLRT
jgi:glycine cleavage system H lipoate-binding protein